MIRIIPQCPKTLESSFPEEIKVITQCLYLTILLNPSFKSLGKNYFTYVLVYIGNVFICFLLEDLNLECYFINHISLTTFKAGIKYKMSLSWRSIVTLWNRRIFAQISSDKFIYSYVATCCNKNKEINWIIIGNWIQHRPKRLSSLAI